MPSNNSNDDRDPEKVLQQSKQNTQLTSEPADSPNEEEPVEDFAAMVEAVYHELENDDLSENLTVRDEDLAALFHAYERTDRLPEVTKDALDQLGRDGDNVNLEARATALRFLLRYALQDLCGADLEDATEGRQAYLMSQASEF